MRSKLVDCGFTAAIMIMICMSRWGFILSFFFPSFLAFLTFFFLDEDMDRNEKIETRG